MASAMSPAMNTAERATTPTRNDPTVSRKDTNVVMMRSLSRPVLR